MNLFRDIPKRIGRRARMRILTVALIVVLAGLSILFSYLTVSRAAYLDLTPEGLYTLTDAMKQQCDAISGELTVTFCADPDTLLSKYETRYVYIMSQQLALRYDNIHLETVNVEQNPGAVDRFRETSATEILPEHVIVSSGDSYRIIHASNFWIFDESNVAWSFNGEYKMASAFLSLTMVEKPVVCFTYGNGESFYVPEDHEQYETVSVWSDSQYSAFYNLLENCGLKVSYVNPQTEEIPEDCRLLVILDPQQDFSYGDIHTVGDQGALERIDRFLQEDFGALMLFKSPEVTLPALEELMDEWGISFRNGTYVRDPSNSLSDAEGTPTADLDRNLIAEYNSDETSMSYTSYKELVGLGSSPRVIVPYSGIVSCTFPEGSVTQSGTTQVTVRYAPFLSSSYSARLYECGTGDVAEEGMYAFTLSALVYRHQYDSELLESQYSYVYAAASTGMIRNDFLSGSYGNYDVMYALARDLSRVEAYADAALGGQSFNSPSPGGKQLVSTSMQTSDYEIYDNGEVSRYYSAMTGGALVGWSIGVLVLPVLVIPAVGIWCCMRRRFR